MKISFLQQIIEIILRKWKSVHPRFNSKIFALITVSAVQLQGRACGLSLMSPIFDPDINLRFLLQIFVVTHQFIRTEVVIRYRFRDEGIA